MTNGTKKGEKNKNKKLGHNKKGFLCVFVFWPREVRAQNLAQSPNAHFGRTSALNHGHNSTRRPPREGRKNENCGGRGKQKERNFGLSGGEGSGGGRGSGRGRGVRRSKGEKEVRGRKKDTKKTTPLKEKGQKRRTKRRKKRPEGVPLETAQMSKDIVKQLRPEKKERKEKEKKTRKNTHKKKTEHTKNCFLFCPQCCSECFFVPTAVCLCCPVAFFLFRCRPCLPTTRTSSPRHLTSVSSTPTHGFRSPEPELLPTPRDKIATTRSTTKELVSWAWGNPRQCSLRLRHWTPRKISFSFTRGQFRSQ